VSGTRFPDFVALSLARATQTRAALPILSPLPSPLRPSLGMPSWFFNRIARLFARIRARAHTHEPTHFAAPDHVFEIVRIRAMPAEET